MEAINVERNKRECMDSVKLAGSERREIDVGVEFSGTLCHVARLSATLDGIL